MLSRSPAWSSRRVVWNFWLSLPKAKHFSCFQWYNDQNVSKMHPKFVHNVSKRCPKCVQSLDISRFSLSLEVWLIFLDWGSKMCLKNVQNVSNYLDTSWTYFGHCLDISNYFRHLSWRCPKNVQKFWTFHTTLDTSWTCFGHIIELDIFWTYVGHILDMLWTLLNPLDAFWTLLCPKCVRPHIVHQSRRGDTSAMYRWSIAP